MSAATVTAKIEELDEILAELLADETYDRCCVKTLARILLVWRRRTACNRDAVVGRNRGLQRAWPGCLACLPEASAGHPSPPLAAPLPCLRESRQSHGRVSLMVLVLISTDALIFTCAFLLGMAHARRRAAPTDTEETQP